MIFIDLYLITATGAVFNEVLKFSILYPEGAPHREIVIDATIRRLRDYMLFLLVKM
jgi:hypothetical protein